MVAARIGCRRRVHMASTCSRRRTPAFLRWSVWPNRQGLPRWKGPLELPSLMPALDPPFRSEGGLHRSPRAGKGSADLAVGKQRECPLGLSELSVIKETVRKVGEVQLALDASQPAALSALQFPFHRSRVWDEGQKSDQVEGVPPCNGNRVPCLNPAYFRLMPAGQILTVVVVTAFVATAAASCMGAIACFGCRYALRSEASTSKRVTIASASGTFILVAFFFGAIYADFWASGGG